MAFNLHYKTDKIKYGQTSTHSIFNETKKIEKLP